MKPQTLATILAAAVIGFWAGNSALAQASSPKPAYEYHMEAVNPFDEDGSINKAAEQGWEPIQAMLRTTGTPVILYRRPKAQ